MARQKLLSGALLMVALASGCGGTDTNADAAAEIASLETDTTAAEQAAAAQPDVAAADTADDAPTEELSREDAQLEFSKCMREKGFDEFPDIAGGNIREALQSSDIDFRDPEVREIMQVCQEVMADAGFARPERSAEEEVAAQEQQLMVAACMRENGYPGFPDPDFDSGGRRGFGQEALADAGIDPRDPDFRTTRGVCQTELGIEGNGRQGAGRQGVTTTAAPSNS